MMRLVRETRARASALGEYPSSCAAANTRSRVGEATAWVEPLRTLDAVATEILELVVRNRGRLLTHRMLLSEVWGPEYAEDVTVLRGQIANLRRKIEPPSAARRHYIRTEPGIGYRFDPR